MIPRLLFCAFVFLPLTVCAQYNYVLDQSIPVQRQDGSTLSNPWAGGVNAAQYNTMDLDGDEVPDLVLFDRMANKVITFVSKDGQYQYSPEYESLFPADVTNWLLLRDYNCDGRKDIFTGHVLGIKVYTNVSPASGPLEWEHHRFFTGASKSPVVLTQGNSLINLQLQFDDLPAIGDADGDGDLDIFNIRYAGSGVEYHQNFSIENGWGCDSLAFTRITQSWGNFTECHCGLIALHGEECPPHGGRVKHAGGKTLLAMDANGDESIDLIFSEAECDQLFLLPNEGTLLSPIINEYAPFPDTYPVNLSTFPAAFYEDVDFDGVKDIISAPNLFLKASLSNNLEESNWFYKNNGSDAEPSFIFIKNNLLQDEMIDVGDNSVPAFADADGDGDYDLFISRNNVVTGFGIASSIHHYENTGSRNEPAFRLITNDFLLFSQTEFYNLKIQFADVNSDGAEDLAWTATSFGPGQTRLYYVLNKSKNSLDFDGQSAVVVSFPTSSTDNLHLADVDGDGHVDILAGRSNGKVEFWKNAGNSDELQFSLEDEDFPGNETQELRQNPACFIGDLNGDGHPDFGYGDQRGMITIIDNYKAGSSAEPITDIILDRFTNSYRTHNLGGRVHPVAVNLFGSSKPAIVVGNTLGGLHVLRNENEFGLFPNPVSKNGMLKIEVDSPTTLEIYTPAGSLVGRQHLQPGQDPYEFENPGLSAGFYLFRFTSAERSFTRKVVIR